jgi:hypothetical protein
MREKLLPFLATWLHWKRIRLLITAEESKIGPRLIQEPGRKGIMRSYHDLPWHAKSCDARIYAHELSCPADSPSALRPYSDDDAAEQWASDMTIPLLRIGHLIGFTSRHSTSPSTALTDGCLM